MVKAYITGYAYLSATSDRDLAIVATGNGRGVTGRHTTVVNDDVTLGPSRFLQVDRPSSTVVGCSSPSILTAGRIDVRQRQLVGCVVNGNPATATTSAKTIRNSRRPPFGTDGASAREGSDVDPDPATTAAATIAGTQCPIGKDARIGTIEV